MKHGIYILTILMALLSLPESGYASIPFFAVANDTIRRAVICFDANEAKVDLTFRDILTRSTLQEWICHQDHWDRDFQLQ